MNVAAHVTEAIIIKNTVGSDLMIDIVCVEIFVSIPKRGMIISMIIIILQ